jgi:hypothetical protein
VLPGLSAALSHPSSPIPDALPEALLSAAKEIRELEGKISYGGASAGSSGANPSRFPSGRRFASYFGLVPRERSSGPSRHLGAITKRGDAYLRTLLIHGTRSVLYAAKRSQQNDRPAPLGADLKTAPRAQPDRCRPGQQARCIAAPDSPSDVYKTEESRYAMLDRCSFHGPQRASAPIAFLQVADT